MASKNYETPPPSPCSFMDPALNNQPVPPDAVRMVGIRKVSGEHLVSLLGVDLQVNAMVGINCTANWTDYILQMTIIQLSRKRFNYSFV